MEKDNFGQEKEAPMLHRWSAMKADATLRDLELNRAPATLSIHWPHVREGWKGGFITGVAAGFQIGYQTANRMADGPKLENDKLRELLGAAIGEAALFWSQPPQGVFDSARASALLNRLMGELGTPLREVNTNGETQLDFPGVF